MTNPTTIKFNRLKYVIESYFAFNSLLAPLHLGVQPITDIVAENMFWN